jgi:bifunctional DNA-binding transcriptional regulator/antitoxin component of YhaV-PrlF toxin-antitoxin module
MAKTFQVVLDEDGDIRIPEALRTSLRLTPGTSFEIDSADEGGIHLRIVTQEAQIVNKGGIVVATGGRAEDIGEAIELDREERMAHIWGAPLN